MRKLLFFTGAAFALLVIAGLSSSNTAAAEFVAIDDCPPNFTLIYWDGDPWPATSKRNPDRNDNDCVCAKAPGRKVVLIKAVAKKKVAKKKKKARKKRAKRVRGMVLIDDHAPDEQCFAPPSG